MRGYFKVLSSIIKPPCTRDCPDRNQWCHSSCEKYKQFKIRAEEERIKMRKQYEKENGVSAYEFKVMERAKKRGHKR